MKILFITDNFPPEFNAPASRTFEHSSIWTKEKDVEIIILTCFPNFPFGKIYPGYKNNLLKTETLNGLKVVRVWTYVASNKGFLKRVFDHLSFSIIGLLVGSFIKCDLIIATSPQFFTTWTAFFLSKLKNVPWIFELRDIWPETISSVKVIRLKFIIKFLEYIELFLYRDCSKVIAVTDSFKKNLISRGILSSKIEVIKNGVNLKLFNNKKLKKNQDIINFKNKLKLKFVVGYIGTHGLCQGLDFIIDSISDLKNEDIHFLFIGDGSEKENLIKISKNKSLKNITFIGSVKKEELPQYYSLIDVSLVCLKQSDTFKSVIPSKIFESCALLKPILLGVDGEARKLINQYNAGTYFIPENKKDFIKKIFKLKEKKFYSSCIDGCNRLANDYDRHKLAKNMLDVIKKVYKSN